MFATRRTRNCRPTEVSEHKAKPDRSRAIKTGHLDKLRTQRITLPNPSITTGETGRGARLWPLGPIRFHPEGAACRGEAPKV